MNEINIIKDSDENLRKLLKMPSIDDDTRRLGIGGIDSIKTLNDLNYLLPKKINLNGFPKDLNFIESDVYKATELMLTNGTRKNAKIFISNLIYNSKSPGQLQIIAKLSKDFDRLDLAIKAA